MQRRWQFVAGALVVSALLANGLVAFAREIEPGDDRSGQHASLFRQLEVGDDRRAMSEIEAVDDRDGMRKVEPGDDRDLAQVQPGDDRGGYQEPVYSSMSQGDASQDASASTGGTLATKAISESQPLDDKGGAGQPQPGDDRGGGEHGDDGGGHR